MFSGRLFAGRLFSGRLFGATDTPAPEAAKEYGGRFFELDKQRHDLIREERELVDLMALSMMAIEGAGLWEA